MPKPESYPDAELTLVVGDPPLDAGGEWYTIQGTGFPPDAIIHFSVSEPFCCAGFHSQSDEDGNVASARMTKTAGTYAWQAFWVPERPGKDKIQDLAALTFVVA